MNTWAPPTVWDKIYDDKAANQDDLNPNGYWTPHWLPFLDEAGVRQVLELGCGTGADALAVAGTGRQVVGLDYSLVAVRWARRKAQAARLPVIFVQADMGHPFPLQATCFDAIISNVAFHMFDDATTRRIVAEMARVLRPGGLVLLHVNSTDDAPIRERRYPRVREPEPGFWLEAHGQTMHFFSAPYLQELFATWHFVHCQHIPLRDACDGHIFKYVWRVVVQKPL